MLDDEKKEEAHRQLHTYLIQVIDKMKKNAGLNEYNKHTYMRNRKKKKRMSRLYFIRFFLC